jgi:hypothetical protein
MDLVEFLRARLDEDERIAKAAVGRIDEQTSYIEVSIQQAEDHIDRFTPERMLAEVEAKRRILDEHFGFLHPHGNPDRACRQCSDRRADEDPLCHGRDRWLRLEPAPCLTVRLLALPYASDPDYREEWKP